MTFEHANSNWVAVDWGTSNFRAYLVSEHLEILDRIEAEKGITEVEQAEFPGTLAKLLEPWAPDYQKLPVILAGMVGSKHGWQEAPYVNAPAGGDELWKHRQTLPLPWGNDAVLIPGVSVQQKSRADVMRGEEVQAIGLAQITAQSEFSAIFPGTHSKHIQWRGEKIADFRTFMTGELYRILQQHSTLLPSNVTAIDDDNAFLLGVETGVREALANSLFNVRVHYVTQQSAPSSLASQLSGICIGHELASLKDHQHVYLVGGASLSRRYLQALEHLGISAEIVSGEKCFVHGLGLLLNQNRSQ